MPKQWSSSTISQSRRLQLDSPTHHARLVKPTPSRMHLAVPGSQGFSPSVRSTCHITFSRMLVGRSHTSDGGCTATTTQPVVNEIAKRILNPRSDPSGTTWVQGQVGEAPTRKSPHKRQPSSRKKIVAIRANDGSYGNSARVLPGTRPGCLLASSCQWKMTLRRILLLHGRSGTRSSYPSLASILRPSSRPDCFWRKSCIYISNVSSHEIDPCLLDEAVCDGGGCVTQSVSLVCTCPSGYHVRPAMRVATKVVLAPVEGQSLQGSKRSERKIIGFAAAERVVLRARWPR
jgi:hypothetical protein